MVSLEQTNDREEAYCCRALSVRTGAGDIFLYRY